MRVFLAGASGAIGLPLARQLTAAGHNVTAMVHRQASVGRLKSDGIATVVGDALNRKHVAKLVAQAQPDAVVNQLTALPRNPGLRRIDIQLGATNRLRTVGMQNLYDAALAAGVRRYVVQSSTLSYVPGGKGPADEHRSLYVASGSPAAAALATLEQIAFSEPAMATTVLRYGILYGPGTVFAPDGTMVRKVLAGRVPIVGRGEGVFSFLHADDAAAAVVAALESGATGTYNIVDDEPVPVADWLPLFADRLGAPKPRRVPMLLALIAGGYYTVYLMCKQPGATNARGKQALGWQPRHPTWRDRLGLSELERTPERRQNSVVCMA